ncbi:Hypothetical_protein [Hexamita inflata]|uniref:Hypothetical_protein n=1 Tax=Hexamita inflata TaxID=28002 RepID=A0AA86PYZ6_9EUKA|nr:Hypothetical protein HINF_LOCUS36589 [Hexamita inflata]
MKTLRNLRVKPRITECCFTYVVQRYYQLKVYYHSCIIQNNWIRSDLEIRYLISSYTILYKYIHVTNSKDKLQNTQLSVQLKTSQQLSQISIFTAIIYLPRQRTIFKIQKSDKERQLKDKYQISIRLLAWKKDHSKSSKQDQNGQSNSKLFKLDSKLALASAELETDADAFGVFCSLAIARCRVDLLRLNCYAAYRIETDLVWISWIAHWILSCGTTFREPARALVGSNRS